jgi:hypothetical protein
MSCRSPMPRSTVLMPTPPSSICASRCERFGLRDDDRGAYIWEPSDPPVELAMDLVFKVWRHNGGVLLTSQGTSQPDVSNPIPRR